jgi:hypothetical protein
MYLSKDGFYSPQHMHMHETEGVLLYVLSI